MDYSQRLNVGQFLAGDGVTDDGPEMRAIIRSGIAAGIKNFYFPAGTYLIGPTYTFDSPPRISGLTRAIMGLE